MRPCDRQISDGLDGAAAVSEWRATFAHEVGEGVTRSVTDEGLAADFIVSNVLHKASRAADYEHVQEAELREPAQPVAGSRHRPENAWICCKLNKD